MGKAENDGKSGVRQGVTKAVADDIDRW